MMNHLAQIQLAPEGGFKGFGRLGLERELSTNADLVFTDFISSAIGLITVIAIIWFVFLVLTSAFGFMTAGNDKNAVESAKKKMANGLIGLLITIFGVFIVKFVGYLIGIPDILNIPNFFAIITDNVVR